MRTFALLSDLHIGLGPRWDETRRVHHESVDLIADRHPDGIIIGGDFHDRGTVPEERLFGADLLLRYAKIAPVAGVAGNHDRRGDLLLYNRLGRAGAHPIRFYEEPDVHRWSEDIAFAMLPWQRDAPALDLLPMVPVDRRAAEEAAERAMLVQLGADLAATGARSRLAVAHIMLKEAKVKLGQPEKRGREFELSLAELGQLGAHAYLLGHVHASDEMAIAGAPVIYPGSTTRRSYGEIEEKYLALVHVDGAAVSIEWVRTGATPMVLSEIAWEELEPGRWGWSTDLAELLADARGADVRVSYKVPEQHREAAALAAAELVDRLKAAGACLTKPEEVVTTVVRARAPEIATTPDLVGKVAITLEQRGVPVADPQHGRVLKLFASIAGAPGS